MSLPDLIYLVGPTGVGKTSVAIALALEIGAEILSIDSRQAYRRLELGTAKPSPAERATVTHHLLDLFAPTERASAADFQRHFARVVQDVRSRGARALAVGGSGLYVDACLGRLDPLPPADAKIRQGHARIVAGEGVRALHRRLADVDPATAKRLAPGDVQRVSRALEVFEQAGVPLSELQTRTEGPLDLSSGPPMLLLIRQRADLYERIAERAAAMVAGGLAAEVARLVAQGVPADAPGLEAIGYAEFARAVRGEINLAQAEALLVRATRRYAKRQLTWFRNRYQGLRELAIAEHEPPAETARRARGLLGKWQAEASAARERSESPEQPPAKP